MNTIVHRLATVSAPANNIGFLELEPPLALPTQGLVASFRFGRSIARSIKNGVTGAGSWGDLSVTGAPEIDVNGAIFSNAGGWLYFADRYPNAPLTILSVYEHPQEDVNALLGGYESNTAPYVKLAIATSGSLLAQARQNAESVATAVLAKDGARSEFVAARFDPGANQITLLRPRTASKVVTPFAGWTANMANTYRIGASNSPSRQIRQIIYQRALSDAEITAIYASVQSSLVRSGIEI